MIQRALNSSYKSRHPRDGAPKHTPDKVPTTQGMKRRTVGDSMHPWLHGRPLDDEAMEKTYSGKEVQPHPGMASKTMGQRGKHVPGLASQVLNEAARLGRPPEKA